MTKFSLVVICSILIASSLAGQNDISSVLKNGMKFKPSAHSSITFHFGSQVWLRHIQNNPGTYDVNGQYKSQSLDLGLRRTRFSMYASFMDESLIVYTQFGMNGQTYSSRKAPQLYFHDAWSAIKLVDECLYLGVGLHGWSGVSRLGSASYAKNLMNDHPGFSLPNLGRTDQAGRQLGLFIKGNAAKFNYRFSIDQPFVRDDLSAIGVNKSNYSPNSNTAYKGYVYYSFLDEEKYKGSYVAMTYLGKKKVLNVGAGFDMHPEAMASLNTSNDTVTHDKRLLGFDVFLDYPLANNSALTFYSAAYLYDFGSNHVRTYGVMNPLKKGDLPQGGGTSHYNVGTGTICYAMAGFLLPDSWQPFKGKLQPMAAAHYKDFEGLSEASMQYDLGFNYYIASYNAKLNLQYSNWAVYKGSSGYQSDARVDRHRGMLVLMAQIYL